VPKAQIDQIMLKKDPAMLAKLVEELMSGK
jgi:hypothetical protein